MQSQRTHSIHTVVFGIALVLFCLVIVSTYMMSGLYARYRSADSMSDGARVAAFSVEAGWGEDVTIDVTETPSGTYTLTVTNQSEVAVRCGLVLTFQSLPSYVSVSLGNDKGTQSGNTVTFENIGELAPNATDPLTKTLTFQINDVALFTSDASEESYSQEFTFDAKITCTQID